MQRRKRSTPANTTEESAGFVLRKPADYSVRVPNGRYSSDITGYEVLRNQRVGSEVVDLLKVRFELENGKTLYSRYMMDLKEFTPLDYLLKAVFGEIPDQINLESLLNQSVTIEVSNKQVGDKTYSNISRVYPYGYSAGDEYETATADEDEDFEVDEEDIEEDVDFSEQDIDFEDM